MQVVAGVTIFSYHLDSCLINSKLLKETATLSSLVVGRGKIGYGDRLRTMLSPYPVGIRQVDAYSCGWILVATKHSTTDGIGNNTLNMRFAETRVNRRVVLKPLGILAYGLGALASLQIFIFHYAFPRPLKTEWVAINLNEAVDEIYASVEFLQPFYRILVKGLEIACGVVVYKQANDFLLLLIFCIIAGFVQEEDNLLDCLAILAVKSPCFFLQLAIFLYKSGVETIGRRSRVIAFLGCIEILYLLLGNTLIEVAG